ncbi:AsmA-like C-terminal region-containing protein [Haloferula chungangensis]|uniref:AsmA-like C-terminal region-containing protein n=1 Tax=Haloferula chungangensis TaxID=1048331 RepID=A0ABW2LBY5_9BACT
MILAGLKRIRIIHRLRVAMALLGFLVLVAALGGLWWANHTGLPDSWRAKIEDALAKQGIYAEVASLRYRPLRGIEAGEVVVYADDSHSRVVARLHELLLDVDRTKLSRGEVKIDRLDLAGARVSLAADPEVPDSETLDILDAQGRILISGGRHMEIQNASGMVGGVRLELDAVLEMFRPSANPTQEEIDHSRAQRRQVLTSVIDALENWGPKGSSPPSIRIKASGDLEDHSTLRATIDVQGAGMKSHSLEVRHLILQAELRGSVIVVQNADISTSNGTLTGRMEYDMWKSRGRFDANSNIDIAALLTSLDMPVPEKMPSFGAPPAIEVRGSFFKEEEAWDLKLMGKLELDQPKFEHLSADRASTAFSWDGNQLFLEDIAVHEGAHQITGRAFITREKVLYEARTDLPPAFWQNAIRFEPLSTILDRFQGSEDTTVSVDFQGTADPRDKYLWTFKGDAAATNISYEGVPALRARTTLDLSSQRLDFSRNEVEFDYRDYPLRKAHGGPMTGQVKVDLIRYDREPSTVTIRNLKGEAWPGPIARTFSPKLAETLETYGFHSNPALEASGVIGVKHGVAKQDFTVRFATAKPANYEFLGANLEVDSPKGVVRVLPDSVNVSDLSLGVFGGLVRGSLKSATSGGRKISGELDWTRVSLPELSKAYDFENKAQGLVTGRLDFTQLGNDVSGLSGAGHIALEKGELFEVPIFGPLSPVISTVLGRRQAGFQEANEAFCTFTLKKGVLETQDFRTATSSIVFTGDALIDLNKMTMFMTLRMNAQGLFGVITLPLRPFYGMFQFRGTGPIREPEWTNVMFTRPPKQQEETLLEPPRARRIEPPGPRKP